MRRRYEIDYPPTAKGRPRSYVVPGPRPFVKLYTPEETVAAENAIAMFVKGLEPPRPVPTGPLEVSMLFKIRKAQRPTLEWPTGRPDIDNYAKLVMDALNGILWADDSQIVLLTAGKAYAERPGIEIEVEPLDVP